MYNHYYNLRKSRYNGVILDCKQFADLYNVPWESFRGHFTGKDKGLFKHLSGGRN